MSVIGGMELPLRTNASIYGWTGLHEKSLEKKIERACEDARSFVVQLASRSDGLAGVDAMTATLGALLTMLVLVRATLLGAVLAYLGTELTQGGSVLAADRHDLDAGPANRRAFEATLGAIVRGRFANHLGRTG